MIAALLLRLGVARWALILALCAATAVGVLGYRSHVYHAGIAFERARRDTIDATNNAAAESALAGLNAHIHQLQGLLDAARAEVARIKTDLDHETAVSTQRQVDLLAGRARERVLVRAASATGQADPAGQAQGAATPGVDQGASFEVDLDPGVASALERVRAEHNAAIERLDACIQSYDAVKAAANAMP